MIALPIVELIRLEESVKYGTIGVLKINKQVFCYTMEPPDRENATSISSIPAQQYLVRHRISGKHGPTYTVQNVPNRSYINFHSGQYARHTEGCILLGTSISRSDTGQVKLLGSNKAFKAFMSELFNEAEFHLTVREVY